MDVPSSIPLEAGRLDLVRGLMRRDDGVHALSAHQLALLRYLVARPSEPVPREVLLREAWGWTARRPRTRATDYAILRIRACIERDPANPRHLLAQPGIGYIFEPLADGSPAAPEPVGVVVGAERAAGLAAALGAPLRTALGAAGELAAAPALVVVADREGALPETARELVAMAADRGLRVTVVGAEADGAVARVPWTGAASTADAVQRLAVGPLPRPAGAAWDAESYVPRPAAERRAAEYAAHPGAPVVLVGPRASGKTWLLRRLLADLPADEDRVVEIDLKAVSAATRRDAAALAAHLALELAEALDIATESVAPALQGPSDPFSRLTRFVEQHALPAAPGRLFLALDDADALATGSDGDGWFGLLRSWASRTREPWPRLRLVMAVSTEPALLVGSSLLSPFNLVPPVRLDPLSADGIARMAPHLDPGDAERIRAFTGGHPWLVRLALDAARALGLDAALSPTAEVWVDHLGSRALRLAADPSLGAAFAAALAGSAPDPIAAQRLVAGGLLVHESGGYAPSAGLYRHLR